MSTGLPLRDRPQSNSSDAPGAWSPQTTPLRIAKRDSVQPQTQLARRQSSSYKHLKNNHLVTESPFRSQIPTSSKSPCTHTPSPRRANGEKRPRPSSMISQTENERPLGFKRRQSRAFQGLLEKERVTKSPFKQSITPELDTDDLLPPQPPKSPRVPSPSPVRSSLVSKRLHGPRISGSGLSTDRRARRKTVTFDERCDVVEFDVEEDTPDGSLEVDHPDTNDVDDTPFLDSDDSSDSSQPGSDSLNDLSDSLLDSTVPYTPPHSPNSLPNDLETEDGVPLGRTHHAERLALHHDEHGLSTEDRLPSIHDVTPPLLPLATPRISSASNDKTPPRVAACAGGVNEDALQEIDQDVNLLPPSPSPNDTLHDLHGDPDISLASFSAHAPRVDDQQTADDEDSFALPKIEVEHRASTPSSPSPVLPRSHSPTAWNTVDADEGRSPIRTHSRRGSSPALPTMSDMEDRDHAVSPLESQPRDEAKPSIQSAFAHEDPASPVLASIDSADDFPSLRVASPLGPAPDRVAAGYHSDEDVPVHDDALPIRPPTTFVEGSAETDTVDSSTDTASRSTCTESIDTDSDLPEDVQIAFPHALDRGKNLTYDGIISIDPDPQIIDPPRPAPLIRAHTVDGVDNDHGFDGLSLNFDRGFTVDGMTIDISSGLVQLEDKSALDRLMENVANDVNGSPGIIGLNILDDREHSDTPGSPTSDGHPIALELLANKASASELTPQTHGSAVINPQGDGHATSPAQVTPSMDAIRAREELIKAKKRESRRREAEEFGYVTSSSSLAAPSRSTRRRRSRSTGDADPSSSVHSLRRRGLTKSLMEVIPDGEQEGPFADAIERELRKLEEPTRNMKYRVRERGETIYASSDDQVSHSGFAGDVNGGKAWRKVTRPSDMNEYSEQIKQLRAQEVSGKAHGKVFVRVRSLRSLNVPLPQQPTIITCTLNNGIHFVTTPECPLGRNCDIEQEFELIEHSKLEFTLTVKVRRDPHIIAQFKAIAPPPLPPAVPPPPASKGGMRGFFLGSSPKKAAKHPPPAAPPPARKPVENLARYLKTDGTLARAFVSFKDIATRCNAELFETVYPLIGQKCDPGSSGRTFQVGDIKLEFFRLPPLPGIPPNQLPQSLEECHRGLKHALWHKESYWEGTLTQYGGDCKSWRRRLLRIVGANLIAYSDVTKKATATINLKKAIAVEDDRSGVSSDDGTPGLRESSTDGYDGPYGIERSFRLVFPGDEVITFFADNDEEKAQWLNVLRVLVGHIPPNPLWAELVLQKQHE